MSAKRGVSEAAAGSRTPAQIVGLNVRGLRDAKGQSQRWLGELMARLGHRWGDTIVSRVERGERAVTVDELFSLALALGEKPTALIAVSSDSVVIGGHVIRAQLYKDWMKKDKFSLGLTPDGLGLNQIVTIGQAVEQKQPTATGEDE